MCFGIQEENTFEFVFFWFAPTVRGMSQHEADLEFSFGKDDMKSHQDENAGIRFVFICISTFFTTRTNFKPKRIQTNSFYFGFVRDSHNT